MIVLEERQPAGMIQVCWICGLPYVWKADRPNPEIELLAAPVMADARYDDRPIYFSDVVVRRDSPYGSFADLQGAVWAYNEPGSHSGYNLTRAHLATLGHTSGFFGRVLEAGAHQTALQLILDGAIDASAIDSTVLAFELQQHPHFAGQIRVIETLGPSPIPPWVVRRELPAALRQMLRQALLGMKNEREGRAILRQWSIARMETAVDTDYDPIRKMARAAETVVW